MDVYICCSFTLCDNSTTTKWDTSGKKDLKKTGTIQKVEYIVLVINTEKHDTLDDNFPMC